MEHVRTQSTGGRLRAYAELARISNLPTCLTNSLVGCALGALSGVLSWPLVGLAALAVALLYAGGMALNDAVDAEFDRERRPDRPIPSGRVPLFEAYIFVAVCFALSLTILGTLSRPALLLGIVLAATIIAYDRLHKRHAATVLLMGACRGLVYLATAAAIAWPLDLRVGGWLSLTLALYTIGLTMVARSETAAALDRRRWIAVALPLLVLLASVPLRPERLWPVLVVAVLLVGWLARAVRAVFAKPPRTMEAVLTWISGMCLVDAYFLTLLNRLDLALVALACTALTAWGHRRILGT
jgi:4-hydroxybenzoate polyprenyltransferase